MRLRRLCSDRVVGDKIFADSLDEYRAYMEARRYDSKSIQGHFAEIANMRRKDSLKKVEEKQTMEGQTNFFHQASRTSISRHSQVN